MCVGLGRREEDKVYHTLEIFDSGINKAKDRDKRTWRELRNRTSLSTWVCRLISSWDCIELVCQLWKLS